MAARTNRLTLVGLSIALMLLVTACGGLSDDPFVERPVEQLYNEALDDLQRGDYELASRSFDEVERQHPYSVWATKAQLMAAYAYYQDNSYDQAVLAAERFIRLHPGHRDAPYAYYLIALSYYEQISDVGRDQKTTRLALKALRDIVRRYPNSEYARDARLKIDLTRDHLAGKEMSIGRYYLRQGNNVAAINRFRTVVEKYDTTTHVPEALYRLSEAYAALGVIDEAKATAAVLGYNYPGSEWYVDGYELVTGESVRPEDTQSSWLGRMWRAVF